jgi:hypothetical protein
MSACVVCQRWCPSGWWRNPESAEQCGRVTCLACGVTQCHGNGSRNGCCRECHYGMLPGWSSSGEGYACSYAGCKSPAVYAYLPGGKRYACKAHGDKRLKRGMVVSHGA